MIIYTHQKSKKKKKMNAKQRELKESWDNLLKKYETKTVSKSVKVDNKLPKLTCPPGRETPYYPSLNTGLGSCTLKEKKVYTGDKLLGIGTLHKSNAVPIFNSEDAKDQANMRR
jgi:hypothetical protein